MYKTVLLISLFLLLSVAMSAQDTVFDQSALSEKGRLAYSTLTTIPIFAIGGVGYSGTSSKGELALDVLIEEKDALKAFKQLITDGTIEGGLYGVVGLKMLECDCFETEFARYKELRFGSGNTEAFSIQFGCTGMTATTPSEKSSTLEAVSGFIFEQAERKERRRRSNGNPQAIQKCFDSEKGSEKP